MNVSISTLLEFKGSHIYSVPSTMTVVETVREMIKLNISAMLVMDGGRLMGLFTARESALRCLAEELPPSKTRVHEVMTTDFPRLTRNMTSDEAVELFEMQHLTHLPVFDGDLVVGVLSLSDLSRWYSMANRAESESYHRYVTTSLGI